MDAAIKLYEAEESAEMLENCNIVLCLLNNTCNKTRLLSLAEFFSICILDMVSRASDIASESRSTVNDTGKHTVSSTAVRRSKALEILFGLLRPTSPFCPFEAISNATGSKMYRRERDGSDLLYYIECCLFKLKPEKPQVPQDTDSLQIQIPSEFERMPMSKHLRDRLISTAGRKKAKRNIGLLAESERQNRDVQFRSRQRAPTQYQYVQTMDDSHME